MPIGSGRSGYTLEQLEPRFLLSAGGLCDGAAASLASDSTALVETCPNGETPLTTQNIFQNDTALRSDGLFSVAETSGDRESGDSAGQQQSESANTPQAQDAFPGDPANQLVSPLASAPDGTTTVVLVETLKAPEPPPGAHRISVLVQNETGAVLSTTQVQAADGELVRLSTARLLDFSRTGEDFTATIHSNGAVTVTGNTLSLFVEHGVESIIGGSGSLTIVFEDGAAMAGTVQGAGGVALDYSAYTTPVALDLSSQSATGLGGFSDLSAVSGAGTITGQCPSGRPLSVHLVPGTPLNLPDGLVVETLSGNGIVNGRLVVAEATRPGNSPGLVELNGDHTLSESETTVIEIGGRDRGASYDAIDVTGALNLDGTLEIRVTSGFETELRPGDTFDIFKAEGGIHGDFAATTGLAIGEITGSDGSTRKLFFDVDLHSDPNKVTLTVLGTEHQMVRPLLFIPGFAGTFPADETPAGFEYWLCHRGIDPWLLALEPLTNGYSSLVSSFENTGYTLGVDLFVANWDWRVPVARSDQITNGIIGGVSAASITDGVFETGLDYLGYWLKQAATAWGLLGNPVLADVDIVTHSTGGLVSRSYIQSAAYKGSCGSFNLPGVHNLVQVGVPNQGLTAAFNFLHDDFAEKLASRVLGRALDCAYDLLQGGVSIFNPDGSLMSAGLSELQFIPAYVGTLKDLLATYDGALDLGDGNGFGAITQAHGGVENTLLLGLNGGADPNHFVDLLSGKATIIYSNGVDTEDRIVLQTGPNLALGLSNEILPFSQYIGDWPEEHTVWYLDQGSNINPDTGGVTEGDGTIATISSAGLFLHDYRLGVKLVLVPMGGNLGHTDLANDTAAQQQIIMAVTGTLPAAGQITTGLELGQVDAALKLVNLGLFDISEFGSELVTRLGPTLLDIGGTAAGTLPTTVFDLAMQNLATMLAGYTVDETLSLGDAGSVVIKFEASTGLQLTADLHLAIDSFLYASGNFTLRMPFFRYDPVTLSNGVEDVPVTPLEVTATGVTLFAGLNGPYWVDADGDHQFDANEANPHAVGLQVTDVDLGMVFFQPQLLSNLPSFYSLRATAPVAGLVGLGGVLQATIRNVRVEVNASSARTLTPPRIDFEASFPIDERLLLFDTSGDGLVTVGELRVASGRNAFSGLYGAGDSAGAVVDTDLVARVLDTDSSGTLEVTEAAAFAGAASASGADKDGDGKLDPPGYEIWAGSGHAPVYLDYDGSQRMAASADSVLLQLSRFVYVIGSFSFQMGPSETVDVATGLPANLGDVAGSLLDAILDGIPVEGTIGLGDGELQITTDLSTIRNLPVETLQMGLSGAHVFVGLNGPYKSDTDGDGSVADETQINKDAAGLVIDNVNLGFVMMASPLAVIPGLDKILPTFMALKATAASAGLVGLEGILQASLSRVLVEVNDASGWPGGLGSPVVDFASSFATDERLLLFDTDHNGLVTVGELRTASGRGAFSGLYETGDSAGKVVDTQLIVSVLDTNSSGTLEVAEAAALAGAASASAADADGDGKLDPAGYEIRTGTATPPVYLTFNGDQRIGASAASVLLQLSQFVYITGSFSFVKGPGYRVDVATGFPSDLTGFASGILTALGALPREGDIGLGDDALSISTDFSTIHNLEVDSMQIGVSGAHVFLGMNGPYKTDTNGNGSVADETEVNQNAIGLVIDHADFGFVMMAPTLASLPGLESLLPKFYALKASADLVAFVGLPAVEMTLEGIRAAVNTGTAWPGEVFGAPVIDFASSFATDERLLLFDTNLDGLVTVGELRAAGGQNAFSGLYGAGDSAGKVVDTELIARVLDANSSGTLEVAEAAVLAGAGKSAAADADGDGKLDPPGLEIRTGVGTPPVYIDFDGNERIGASVARATIQISEFVYITGSVAFEKGPGATVNTAGGLLGQVTVDAGKLLSTYGLPADTPIPVLDMVKEVSFMTIGAVNVHAFVGMHGPYWVDADGDSVIDRDPVTGKIVPAEVNPQAVGLVLDDLDFAMAIMSPSNPLDPGKYFALHASARSISLEGIAGVTVKAEHILVDINQSSPTVYGVSLFPVVDFATTPAFADERLALFDTNDDGLVTVGDLRAASGQSAFSGLYGAEDSAGKVVDTELIARALDTNSNGTLEVSEAAVLTGPAAAAADADGDGKIDPLGLEVKTGGAPLYLAMGTALIRAQGFAELKILDSLYLTGSIAFEMGPTRQVTLTDGTTKTVTTMTIGAANVTAFIGANGPYWTDTDGDHSVDSGELNSRAIGFHITDLDAGIMVMASVGLSDIGLYLAVKASVESFGVVGIPMLDASGRFDIAINTGIGTASGAAVVDFTASFNEILDLLDTNGDGKITVGELRALAAQGTGGAHDGLYTSTDADAQEVSWAQIAHVLDAAGNGDGLLQLGEAQALLLGDTPAEQADADGNGTLDVGFKVNTGDPTSPAVLAFDQFLISIQLGGQVTVYSGSRSDSSSRAVFRLNGLLLFEADTTGLKAFVAAGLEFGPDIGATGGAKLFDMNALGGLVINAGGMAADIDVSVSVGGALRSVLAFNATARLVFNTTGADQAITIPARYVAFLDGTVDLSGSEIESELHKVGVTNTTELARLTGTLDDRFTMHPDGSAGFTIRGRAPPLSGTSGAQGAYFLVSLHGDLTIASAFVITADFQLTISTEGLAVALAGKIDLSIFGRLDVTGGAVIRNGVFAMYVNLGAHVISGIPGLSISGDFTLRINTGGEQILVNGNTIEPHTYQVAIAAAVDLFGLFQATGNLVIGAESGVLAIEFNDISINFFGIVDVAISGFVSSNGSFSLAGGLDLDLTIGSGITEFGIKGDLGVTIKNTGISGHGSVALVVLGEDINVASAALSVNWQNAAFKVRAEGPLGVWLEVTGDRNSWDIDGGLGVFDAVFDAIGDAAEAAGEAVVEAAEAVADALEDLGDAILDFGSDVVDFFDGLLTDIGNLVGDVIDEISSWFDDSKTVVNDLSGSIDPFDYYSYSARLSEGTLIIDNRSASRLCLAVVGRNLIVDGPDVTASVVIAEKVHYTRYFRWKWGFIPLGWSDWSEQSRENIYRDVTVSNMMNWDTGTVSRIVINGTDGPETIVADGNSISIPMSVYGNGGNDIIVTGKGNDYVEGGAGNDTIFTNEGNDTLLGGDGDDKLLAGTGNDALSGGAGNDLLDESYGRASPDSEISETNTLSGGPGNDTILGSPGRDTIAGGPGNDLLLGLYNDDTYTFEDNCGADTLVDYNGRESLIFSGTTSGTFVAADEVIVTAAGPVTLVTTVNTFAATTSGPGGITVNETDGISLANVVSANGPITVTAGGDIFAGLVRSLTDAAANDIVLKSTVGDIWVGQVSAGSHGDVSLEAAGAVEENGSDTGIDITARELDIHAGWGIGQSGTIETAASVITADTTDGGIDLENTLASAVTAASLTTDSGDILFHQAGGGALAVGLAQTGDGDISISVSGGSLTVVGAITGREVSLVGDRVVSLAGSLITAEKLEAAAGSGMVLIIDVDVLAARVSGVGDITVSERDAIILEAVETFNGSIAIAAGDIWVGQVSAGSHGDVSLDAAGAVAATDVGTMVIADELIVTAAGPITLVTAVNTLTATTSGVGDVIVTETDAITLTGIRAYDGSIAVTAGGAIMAAMVASLTDADSNDIMLTSTGGAIEAAEINAGALGDVILASAGYLTAAVTADDLVTTAAGDIILQTTVARMIAETTVAGALAVRETDTIELSVIRAFDGAISITADGTITAVTVESVRDAEGNDVALATTRGDILIGLVRAGRIHGRVVLTSAGNIREMDAFDPDVDLAGRSARIEVAGEFGSSLDPNLEVELDLGTLEFSGHDLILHHRGDIELIVTATGIIDAAATGTITATWLASGQGRITVHAGGDILVDFIDAGACAGEVSLTAGGSILETAPGDNGVDLVARKASLFAGARIGGSSDENRYLEAELGILAAEGGRSIHISEKDDIALASAVAPAGEIDLIAGGEILITGVVSTGTAAGTISLQAGGRIFTEGDEPVATDLLRLIATSSIFLRTRVNTLDASLSGQGILEIREADAVVLRNLKNADGPIRVIAGGSVTAVWIESLADEAGNNIGLMTLGGDIVVDYVGAGTRYGQISLSSAGGILEAANHDSAVDLKGALGILYAQGRIDKGLDGSFKATRQCGQKYALYEFERGEKMNLCSLEGDVELFVSLGNEVHVLATGTISVTYLDSHGRDVFLRSKYEDVCVEYLSSGPCRGDIELDADGSVRLAEQRLGGEIGQITAGDDLRVRAGDEIRLLGSVSAGGDIDLRADGGIIISGVIAAGDNIRVTAERGAAVIEGAVHAGERLDVSSGSDLTISAPLQAGGRLELYARGTLRTVNDLSTLTAGTDVVLGTCHGDIELLGAITAGAGYTPSRCHERPDVVINAGGALHLHGVLTSPDDVFVFAWGDIDVSGTIAAGDEVRVSTFGDLTLLPGSLLTGLSGNKARRVTLFAHDQVNLQGTISAEELVVIPKARCCLPGPR
jgi:Ca2+-binding EF-hand superfamily protein